jgi:hypothetical protein
MSVGSPRTPSARFVEGLVRWTIGGGTATRRARGGSSGPREATLHPSAGLASSGLVPMRAFASLPFLQRGLPPSVAQLLPRAKLEVEVHFEVPLIGVVSTGDVLGDGSGSQPTCRLRNRVVFGAVMVSNLGEVLGSVYGPAPLLIQEVRWAEAYALLVMLEHALPPPRFPTDCHLVVDLFLAGKAHATKATNPYADVWERIYHVLGDFLGGVEFVKTKAHVFPLRRCLHQEGAACPPVDAIVLLSWLHVDARTEVVARYLAHCTARQGHLQGHVGFQAQGRGCAGGGEPQHGGRGRPTYQL